MIAVYHDLTICRHGWAPSSLTRVALNFPMSIPDIFTTQDLVRNPRLLLHRSGPAESQLLPYFQYKALISLARGPFDGQVGCAVGNGTCVVYSPNMNHIWHLPISENRVMKIRSDGRYADDDFLCWPQMYNET